MATFADLHRGELPLLLPNVWDLPSALAMVDAGFPAIGTTSFGVASAAGFPDGARASRLPTRVLAAGLRDLPAFVTIDIEDGYSDEPDEVAAYAGALAVDGVNIEDSTAENLIDPDRHAAKIRAIKARAPGVFVNARVDTYWLGQQATVEETLRRARLYEAAGADGIFVPGASEPGVVRTLGSSISLPLNVLAVPGRSLREHRELGVRRVSTGSLPYRAAMRAAVDAAAAVRDGAELPPAALYQDMQERLIRYNNGRRRAVS
jgi:2-methylisocitrate lyase-like PEP mutase family enzyme